MAGRPKQRYRRAEKALQRLLVASESTLNKEGSLEPPRALGNGQLLLSTVHAQCPNCEAAVEIEISIDLEQLARAGSIDLSRSSPDPS